MHLELFADFKSPSMFVHNVVCILKFLKVRFLMLFHFNSLYHYILISRKDSEATGNKKGIRNDISLESFTVYDYPTTHCLQRHAAKTLSMLFQDFAI